MPIKRERSASRSPKKVTILDDNNSDLLDRIDVLEGREIRFVDTIKALRLELDAEKAAMREMKQEKNHSQSNKGQMEELFMECVNEVRKDIGRRK